MHKKLLGHLEQNWKEYKQVGQEFKSLLSEISFVKISI